MRTSTTKLIVILTIGAVALAANSALACGGYSSHKSSYRKYSHKYVKTCYEPTYVYDHCYRPHYRFCFVYPGDTWYTIAKRCYGYSNVWKHIATYNNLGFSSSVLIPGQQLRLPVINANGTLAASTAPAPAAFNAQAASFGQQGSPIGPQAQSAAPQGLPNGLNTGSQAPQGATTAPLANPAAAPSSQPMNSAAPAAPAANIRTVSQEPKRPIVTIGSTLALDGESLGTEKGIVRLRISGLAMPVEVLEWNDSSVMIQMPTLDLAKAMNAELEVRRADGSLASKSAIELTPAATRLALGN